MKEGIQHEKSRYGCMIVVGVMLVCWLIFPALPLLLLFGLVFITGAVKSARQKTERIIEKPLSMQEEESDTPSAMDSHEQTCVEIWFDVLMRCYEIVVLGVTQLGKGIRYLIGSADRASRKE